MELVAYGLARDRMGRRCLRQGPIVEFQWGRRRRRSPGPGSESCARARTEQPVVRVARFGEAFFGQVGRQGPGVACRGAGARGDFAGRGLRLCSGKAGQRAASALRQPGAARGPNQHACRQMPGLQGPGGADRQLLRRGRCVLLRVPGAAQRLLRRRRGLHLRADLPLRSSPPQRPASSEARRAVPESRAFGASAGRDALGRGLRHPGPIRPALRPVSDGRTQPA